MRNPLMLLVVLLFSGAVISYYIYMQTKKQEQLEVLQEAYSGYVMGETAENFGERENAFNQSLTYYTDLEEMYHPVYGNGKLYFNIGNNYFQLEDYPFAALYYYKAQKLMPREDVVERNLLTALAKLGLTNQTERSVFQTILFFHFFLSIPEQLQLIFLFSLAAFFSISIFIWTRKQAFKTMGKLFVFVSMVFLASCAYFHYLSPIEAVIVKSSALYRDSGFQYAKVQEEPILSGSKVEVLGLINEGEWLKIRLQGGNLGYVPQETVRII